MYCSQCGSSIPANAAFCPSCGQKVQIPGERQDISWNSQSAPPIAASGMVAGGPARGLGEVSSNPTNQDAQIYGVNNYPARSQRQDSSVKKSRKPIIVGGVLFVIVVSFAAVIMVMFGQNFGVGEKAHVLSKMTAHNESKDSGNNDVVRSYTYTRDAHGNITKREDEHSLGLSASLDIVVDENGYATSFSVAQSYDDAHYPQQYSGTCDNVVDAKGRLSQTTLNTSTGTSLTVRYSYFDDTYKLRSATYSDIVNKDSATGILTLINYSPPQFEPVAMGEIVHSGGIWRSGYSDNAIPEIKSLICYYSEDGMLTSIDKDGNTKDFETGKVGPREQRKGKTVTTQNGERSIETTYDENGNSIYKKEVVDGEDPRTETREYSYTEISSPSKSVLIFESEMDIYR